MIIIIISTIIILIATWFCNMRFFLGFQQKVAWNAVFDNWIEFDLHIKILLCWIKWAAAEQGCKSGFKSRFSFL